MLSFPAPGWCLAVDVPAHLPDLEALFRRLDDAVAAAGGRVYLSKDARLGPEHLRAMYPDLDKWQAVRDSMDPEHRIQSDMSRRLALTPRS
jgi:decaprenylphospho-beta-D-ribofuranose 2-oxidase